MDLLRNKKTGKIETLTEVIHEAYEKHELISLTRLNEEWEGYNPQEPLIKDEKIRKAVRAWAYCNLLDDDDRVFLSKPTFDCKILGLEYGMLKFDVYYDDESLCDKHYTIAELCGEEE